MTVVVPEEISGHILRYRFHDENVTAFLLRCLSRGMCFVDIGAHFGYFTLLAAKLVGTEGSIHAFEPAMSTFRILEFNAAGQSNITVRQLAIMARRAQHQIRDLGPKYSAYNTLYAPRLDRRAKRSARADVYEVDAISLDEYVEEHRIRPDFIKIDAESAEHEILRGMRTTLRRYRPLIALEVGDMGIPGVPTSRQLIEAVTVEGYRPFENKAGQVVGHVLQDHYRYGNLLFLPE